MERRRAELAREGKNATLEYQPVALSRISSTLSRAVIAAEDARFYEHGGVDWLAVRGALERDWQRRRLGAGGSTLTQQLAKNLYLSPARTPWRILELYLNVVEFGPRTYGAEAAARHYFHKPAALLSAHEAATLAAVIPSPRIYDPVRQGLRLSRRADRILRRM